MCFMSSPKMPTPPPPVAEPVAPPVADSAEVKAAAEKERLAAVKARGRSSTVLTGGLGVTEQAQVAAPAASKVLLGG